MAENISVRVLAELVRKSKVEKTNLVFALEQLSQENAAYVGGKAANLGEVSNRVNLPVPPGFAVTAYACLYFLEKSRLMPFIQEQLKNLDVNDNYVTFSFKGGAADIGRRTRRAGLIAAILKELEFKVEHKVDMVRGQMKKYDDTLTAQKLDMLGRLLGSVRLLDMVLTDDRQVQWYSEQFFKGNYTFRIPGEGK